MASGERKVRLWLAQKCRNMAEWFAVRSVRLERMGCELGIHRSYVFKRDIQPPDWDLMKCYRCGLKYAQNRVTGRIGL